MAKHSISWYYYPSSSLSHLLIFSLLAALAAKPTLSLSHRTNPNFDPDIALHGDASFVHGDSSVQLTRPSPSSSGLLVRTRPFKFIESNPPKPTSFSTDFTFSISPRSGDGDGLSLVIVPTDFPRRFSRKDAFELSRENLFLRVQFDADHIAVDASALEFSGGCNASSIDLVMNSGVGLRTWIDYEASSKRLEIRLTKLGNERPYDPYLTYPIDLSEMWKEEEVLVGLSSSNGNSSRAGSTVHSWRFRVRTVPDSLHSQPLDPRKGSDRDGDLKLVRKKRSCPLGVLYGFVLAAGCGALVALAVLVLWKGFFNGDRGKVVTGEFSLGPTDFRYEKVNVVVESKGPLGNLGKPVSAL